MENVLACLFLKLIFALFLNEIRHKRRYCQWENLFTHIHYIYKEKLNKWKGNWRTEKWVKE